MRVRILAFVLLIMLVTTGTISLFVSNSIKKDLTTLLEQEAWNLIESVMMHVEIEYNSIDFYRDAALQERKQQIKTIVDLSIEVIHSYFDLHQRGEMSEEDARRHAMETLRRMRYDDGVGYIWLNNLDDTMPTLDMHPVFPELEGLELTDSRYYTALGKQRHLLKAFVDIATSRGSGYVDYLWPKPLPGGVTEDRQKLSYVTLYEPWEWVVGTGVYIDDIDAAAERRLEAAVQELRDTLGRLKLGPNGYMFIFDGTGLVLAHPNLNDQSLDDIINMETGNSFFVDIAGSVTASDGIFSYNWNKPTKDLTDLSYEKITYTEYFAPLDWYVSASFYSDEIFEPVSVIRRRILLITSGFVLVAVLLAVFLSKSLVAPLQRLAKTAESIVKHGLQTANVPICGTNETQELGVTLSTMLDSLKEREQQLQGIAQTVPGSIYQLLQKPDGGFSFTYMSEKAISIFNIPKEEILSFDYFCSMLDPNDKSRFLESLTKSIENDAIWFYEGCIKKTSGHDIWIQGRGTPIRQNELVVLNGILLDVTEQKQTELQLRQSQKMDSIGQLAGGVAHDFNNMLGGIIGFSELMSLDLDSDSPLQEHVKAIKNAAENAAELTRKLLAFSRQGKSLSTAINVHDCIAHAVEILQRSIDKKIEIKQKSHADQSTIVGDPTQLENVFLNLGLNARDAMPDGGILTYSTDNIELDSEYCNHSHFNIEPGLYIVVRVEDTGCGIAKHLQEKIFDPFFTTKEVGQGTGLGLSAVYGTVNDHHGEIHLYSEDGQGAAFNIYFPVDTTEYAVEQVGTVAGEDTTYQGEGCVLIVDDEAVVRAMAKSLFQGLGYTVVTADNGADGIAKLEEYKGQIDLIVLDLIMPKMDGRECYYEIRKRDPNVKVLLSSGFTKNQSVSDLLADGVAGFIKKPYHRHEVCNMLRTLFPNGSSADKK